MRDGSCRRIAIVQDETRAGAGMRDRSFPEGKDLSRFFCSRFLCGEVGLEDLRGWEVFERAGEDVAVEDDEVRVVAGGE